METLSFNIIINATKNKIWDILWSPQTYPEWTQFFAVGCKMETDWKIDGKTYFLDSSGNGMVATISTLEEPNEVTFNHIGVFQDGVEDTESEEVKQWSGAPERYYLIGLDDGSVKLHIEVQTANEWKEHLEQGFQKGLTVIKSLAENTEMID